MSPIIKKKKIFQLFGRNGTEGIWEWMLGWTGRPLTFLLMSLWCWCSISVKHYNGSTWRYQLLSFSWFLYSTQIHDNLPVVVRKVDWWLVIMLDAVVVLRCDGEEKALEILLQKRVRKIHNDNLFDISFHSIPRSLYFIYLHLWYNNFHF